MADRTRRYKERERGHQVNLYKNRQLCHPCPFILKTRLDLLAISASLSLTVVRSIGIFYIRGRGPNFAQDVKTLARVRLRNSVSALSLSLSLLPANPVRRPKPQVSLSVPATINQSPLRVSFARPSLARSLESLERERRELGVGSTLQWTRCATARSHCRPLSPPRTRKAGEAFGACSCPLCQGRDRQSLSSIVSLLISPLSVRYAP